MLWPFEGIDQKSTRLPAKQLTYSAQIPFEKEKKKKGEKNIIFTACSSSAAGPCPDIALPY